MTRARFDLVVVGGGPAGSAAALVAARAGMRVLLLERTALPRDRPGETLHPGVEPLLRHLGATEALHSATTARHAGHWDRGGPKARFLRFGRDDEGEWLGFQASRRQLEAGLRECAANVGVKVLSGAPVRTVLREAGGRVVGVILASGEEVCAGTVIDAAGDRHWLARRLGLGVRRLSPRYVATYGYAKSAGRPPRPPVPADPEFIRDEEGWTWIAPLGGGRWHWTRLSFSGRRMPADWRPAVLKGLRSLGASRGSDVTWRVVDTAAGPGWLIAGDALAVLDPASSHGVLRAIIGGGKAGAVAVLATRTPRLESDLFSRYSDDLRGAVKREAQVLRGVYAAWAAGGAGALAKCEN